MTLTWEASYAIALELRRQHPEAGIVPPGPNTLKVFIEASGLRNKQKLIDMLTGPGDDPKAQQQMAEQQKMQQEAAALAKAKAEADIRATNREGQQGRSFRRGGSHLGCTGGDYAPGARVVAGLLERALMVSPTSRAIRNFTTRSE